LPTDAHGLDAEPETDDQIGSALRALASGYPEFRFFRESDGDPDDVVQTGVLEVPSGSPIAVIAATVAADPVSVRWVAALLAPK
jgi:hypothetical protein